MKPVNLILSYQNRDVRGLTEGDACLCVSDQRDIQQPASMHGTALSDLDDAFSLRLTLVLLSRPTQRTARGVASCGGSTPRPPVKVHIKGQYVVGMCYQKSRRLRVSRRTSATKRQARPENGGGGRGGLHFFKGRERGGGARSTEQTSLHNHYHNP